MNQRSVRCFFGLVVAVFGLQTMEVMADCPMKVDDLLEVRHPEFQSYSPIDKARARIDAADDVRQINQAYYDELRQLVDSDSAADLLYLEQIQARCETQRNIEQWLEL